MSESGTLKINLSEGRGTQSHQYNVKNIAYLDIADHSPPLYYWAIVFVCGLITFPVGVLIWAYFYYKKRGGDGLLIGTITGTKAYDLTNTEALESEFLQKSSDSISITGTKAGLLGSFEYRYHFIPDNIVMIEHRTPSLSIVEWLLLSAVVFFPPVFSYALASAGVALLVAMITLTIGGLLYYILSNQKEGITIHLQSGSEQRFKMSSSDANRVVSEFSH